VDYWEELKEIFDWTQTNIHSTMAVCWGAMAMMYFFSPNSKILATKKGLWLL
jgi:homoserine O-succinyltransferase